MQVTVDSSTTVVTKRARTSEERESLGREAAILRSVVHPGVVQLIAVEGGDPPESLLLRQEVGGDLSAFPNLSAEETAGVGAALATVVADLHDLGVTHHAIEPTHVLFDDQGRPVLCSFGRADRRLAPFDAESRRQDVAALASLLLDRLPGGAPSRTVRALRLAARAGHQPRVRDARWLARQLATTVPGACLPVRRDLASDDHLPIPPSPAATNPTSEVRRRPVRIAVGLTVLGIGALVATSWWPRGSVALVPCPVIDLGCRPVPLSGRILSTPTGRYQLDESNDVVVVGRWRCRPAALPALLRPGTGQVWTFAAWPAPGRDELGRLIGEFPSAWSLRVRPRSSGCDQLVVEQRGQPPLTLDPLQK